MGITFYDLPILCKICYVDINEQTFSTHIKSNVIVDLTGLVELQSRLLLGIKANFFYTTRKSNAIFPISVHLQSYRVGYELYGWDVSYMVGY